MAEKTVTLFLFVPGREWLMTTAHVSSEAEMKACAEDFAKAHGKGKWTEMRVYTHKPLWQARPAECAWDSSGVTPWDQPEATGAVDPAAGASLKE